jgi:negative regulator of replication initiation
VGTFENDQAARGKDAGSKAKAKAKSSEPATAETYDELSKQGRVKFWLRQIEQQQKDDKQFLKRGDITIRTFRQSDKAVGDERLSRFNILASNVDVLMPALYSSTPQPDIRRRNPDADPVGRVASDVLERALKFEHDEFDVDEEMEASVLDMQLPGRGVARVMYEAQTETTVPDGAIKVQPHPETDGHFVDEAGATIAQTPDGMGWGKMPTDPNGEWTPVPGAPEEHKPARMAVDGDVADDGTNDWYFGGTPYPKVLNERTWFEHIPWTDYLEGPGRTWREVQWIAIKHALTRVELRKLPIPRKVADCIELDYDTRDPSNNAKRPVGTNRDPRARQEDLPFKRAIVWEVWDKTTKKVIFVAPSYTDAPLIEKDPEIRFENFFPVPRPLLAIENPDDREPYPPYYVYKGLAEELNRALRRLQKLVSALKVRGIYAGANVDFNRVFQGDDNELIPASDALPLLKDGARAMDDLIWLMPVDKLVEVVNELYKYVENIKQTIYEATGISDIARGQTKASETLGAQQLKAQFASVRIMRGQRQVQRFARDLIRMEAEVICKIFSPETLQRMTGIELPTAQEKQMAMRAAFGGAGVNAPPGAAGPMLQDLPPQAPDGVPLEEFLKRPTWDEVMGVLENDMLRSYKIDIETDSTIAADIAQQQGEITQLIQGIVSFFTGIAPFVQGPNNPTGILPPEAAKTILMAAVRKYRLGKEVEEALDMIGQQQIAPGASTAGGAAPGAPAAPNVAPPAGGAAMPPGPGPMAPPGAPVQPVANLPPVAPPGPPLQ